MNEYIFVVDWDDQPQQWLNFIADDVDEAWSLLVAKVAANAQLAADHSTVLGVRLDDGRKL